MSDEHFSAQPQTVTPAGTPAPSWELSGWWKRVAALVIDQVVVLVPLFIVLLLGSLAREPEPGSGSSYTDLLRMLGFLAGIFVVPAIYYCWIMSKTNGQTVGKRALGIRVVREDGSDVTAGFAFRRQILIISWGFSFLGGVFLFGLPIVIDYLWPLWDNKNQALHDKLVKSRVVLSNPTVPVSPGAASMFPSVPPTAPPVPAEQHDVAPPPTPAAPFPQERPAPEASTGAPPPPPPPTGTSTPYTPPPGFENPVPDEEK